MSRNKPRSTSGSSPLIDIVVVTAGRFDMLKICLAALDRDAKSVPMNVWLIDNGSDAEERIANEEIFRKEYSWANAKDRWTKRLTQNVGFPASNNEGARMGKAPLIMFLNDDAELIEGSLQRVIDDFKDPKVGVVGIKLLFPETSTSPIRPAGKVQHVGMAMNIRGEPIHPLVGWSKDNPKTCKTGEVWAVTGACLSVRRDLFNKAGGFDQIYTIGTYEDLDLCLQIRKLGYKIILDAEALGYHYVGATAEKRQQPFPMAQNLGIFRTRWQPLGLLSWDEWKWW